MKIKNFKKKWILVILLGILIGFVNGFFGGGGGMICVPLLENVLKLETKNAHASTIAVILPLSLISSIVYMISNRVNYLDLGMITLGVCIGGVIGALVLKRLNSNIIRLIFVAIMIFAGIMMIVG